MARGKERRRRRTGGSGKVDDAIEEGRADRVEHVVRVQLGPGVAQHGPSPHLQFQQPNKINLQTPKTKLDKKTG